jgi:5S rRNA maturation endonuclease (ribonuclease M5)
LSGLTLSEKKDRSLSGKADIFRARSQQRAGKKRLRDNERALIDIIQKLDHDYEGLLVVVEGKRDELVLRSLGLKAPVVKTQSGTPRQLFIDQLASATDQDRQVLILTDFDDEGNELCRLIEQELEVRRVRVLRRLRREMRKAMGNWRCIEELVALFKRRDSPEPVA